MPGPGRSIIAVVVALVGLSSCSDTAPAPPPPPATVHETWVGCDALGAFDGVLPLNDLPGKGGIPAGFTPVAAILCETGEQPGKAAQTTPVAVGLERRAVELDPLLTYLSRPGRISTDPDDLVCPAMAWLPPWLFLLDASGRWIAPQLPTDECGFSLDEFADTPAPWTTLSYTDKVVRIRPS